MTLTVGLIEPEPQLEPARRGDALQGRKRRHRLRPLVSCDRRLGGAGSVCQLLLSKPGPPTRVADQRPNWKLNSTANHTEPSIYEVGFGSTTAGKRAALSSAARNDQRRPKDGSGEGLLVIEVAHLLAGLRDANLVAQGFVDRDDLDLHVPDGQRFSEPAPAERVRGSVLVGEREDQLSAGGCVRA